MKVETSVGLCEESKARRFGDVCCRVGSKELASELRVYIGGEGHLAQCLLDLRPRSLIELFRKVIVERSRNVFFGRRDRRFVKTAGLALNTGTPQGLLAAQTFNADSRNFARLLKFPSGELPSLWDGSSQLTVGESSGGRGPLRTTHQAVRSHLPR